MNTTRLTQARRLFSSPWVPESQNRANRRAWCASIRKLGSKWLLATAQQKKGQS